MKPLYSCSLNSGSYSALAPAANSFVGRAVVILSAPAMLFLPKQDRLWTAKHLDPFDVHEGRACLLRAAAVDAVHVRADRLLETRVHT